MRCPNCYAPVPSGSSICLDCGRKISIQKREPWEGRSTAGIQKNRGELRYRLDQREQKKHENAHERGTAHGASRGVSGTQVGKQSGVTGGKAIVVVAFFIGLLAAVLTAMTS